MDVTPLAALLEREHRDLDALFGRFLAAASNANAAAARDAIAAFDEALTRHTEFEETRVIPAPAGHKLAPPESEADATRASIASCASSTSRCARCRR